MQVRSRTITTLFVAAAVLAGGTVPLLAQDDVDAQIAKLQKETQLLQAQKAKQDAENQLTAAKAAADLEAQKSVADAQKNLADSQKSVADAQTQAWIARNIGTVAAGPYSGAVGVNDKAGVLEALLLASKAVHACANTLVASVKSKCTSACGPIFVYRESEIPRFNASAAFRLRAAHLKTALQDAIQYGKEARSASSVAEEEFAGPAVIGAVLGAAGNLLGYFKTDSTVNGIDAKLDEAALLNAVAGALSEQSLDARVPTLYGGATKDAIDAVVKQMDELYAKRAAAAHLLNALNTRIAAEEADIAAATKASDKVPHQKTAAALRPAAADLTSAIALYDAFYTTMTTADQQGNIPLVAVAQEESLRKVLQESGTVLLIRLETTGGGTLVKKNLLTGLGAMPLYHMGGAAVSYVLVSGKEGKVLDGGIIPFFGGYTRSDKLAATLGQ